MNQAGHRSLTAVRGAAYNPRRAGNLFQGKRGRSPGTVAVPRSPIGRNNDYDTSRTEDFAW